MNQTIATNTTKQGEQKVFIFIGRSGCGKGTQAKLLIDYLKNPASNSASTGGTSSATPRDVLYIQTGLEFREFIKGNTATQKLSKAVSDKGNLQPEFLAVYLWIKALVDRYDGTQHLVLDGMPRKYHEAGVLDSIFDFYGLKRATVIHIDVSHEWAKDRLMSRGREDDSKEEIEKRLGWYNTDVEPTLKFFKVNSGYTFISIDGERKPEEVFADIVSKIG